MNEDQLKRQAAEVWDKGYRKWRQQSALDTTILGSQCYGYKRWYQWFCARPFLTYLIDAANHFLPILPLHLSDYFAPA